MRAVISRVSSASVTVDGDVIAHLPRPGLLVLLGVGLSDDLAVAQALARKTWGLRILDGEVSASDVDAPILVVSQFTLHASTRKGRRPGWSKAAPGAVSEPLVEAYAAALEELGATVSRGRFGADMQVASVNDGPFTILIDTENWD
ncbi:D-tyrosyl-tRNA(Tyr) deacylase [Arachnia propionica]|uniref:D-aminoacyl-tRNA deacylase n=1 Tax=Arachnia propionica TaxID=1750 RepID=A0A3P1T3S7_9ACTN|nr:D-aminoacyl-tRNA deacylase [Arachnia propionica]RRD04131.1 D-tyrosyl-tRNA(Tyr) deacylase [Arachnia propionica]